MEILDSGKRDTFTSGAVRDGQEGKGFYDCLPYEATRRIALIYEGGAKKYDKHNCRKGMPLSRFFDSAKRHLDKAIARMDDEDHLAMVAWNIGEAMELLHRIQLGVLPPKLDDVPNFYADVSEEAVLGDHNIPPFVEGDFVVCTCKLAGTGAVKFGDKGVIRKVKPDAILVQWYDWYAGHNAVHDNLKILITDCSAWSVDPNDIKLVAKRHEADTGLLTSVPIKRKLPITAYLSHPIRGKNGADATQAEINANNIEAKNVARAIRSAVPDLELYCPADHDEVVGNLYKNGDVSIDSILKADCEIIAKKDLLIVYRPNLLMSEGMLHEIAYADTKKIPVIFLPNCCSLNLERLRQGVENIRRAGL